MISKERFIVHIDMDAFFAAIEERDNPRYRGKPVVVGSDPKAGQGRGVVSTCSYAARKFGIHSAMPISIAYRKCPNAVFLPVDMPKYKLVSEQILKILGDFSPAIEQVSIDEAFLDISDTYKLHGSAHDTCLAIKNRIKKETGLSASIGLAPTKMAAKIASDFKKPDGLVEVSEKNLLEFLWPLDVGYIWGIGPKTKAVLNQMGIQTIGGLAKHGKDELVSRFGKSGVAFWEMSRGIDESEVQTQREIKSISNEMTFDKDTLDEDLITKELVELCEDVSLRLRQEGFKCRTVTLKIRLAGFETHTRSVTMLSAINLFDGIYKEIKRLYDNFENRGKKIRLLGVKASGFSNGQAQESLFEDKLYSKRRDIQSAVDRIREKYGKSSIYRGNSI